MTNFGRNSQSKMYLSFQSLWGNMTPGHKCFSVWLKALIPLKQMMINLSLYTEIIYSPLSEGSKLHHGLTTTLKHLYKIKRLLNCVYLQVQHLSCMLASLKSSLPQAKFINTTPDPLHQVISIVHKSLFASIGAKIWNSIPANLKKLSKRTFTIHNLLFLNLQNQDSYADIDNLIY